MDMYELDYDEGILIQATEVERYGAVEDFLAEVTLTNKHLIYVIERSTGLFSKSQTEVAKIPVGKIKVINGQAMVKQVNHDDWGLCLQIQFVFGIQYLRLDKKAIPQWIAEFNRLLCGTPVGNTPVLDGVKNAPAVDGRLSGVASTFKSIAGTAKQAVSSMKSSLSEPHVQDSAPVVESTPSIISSPATVARFCSNCGTKLGDGAKFCMNCGTPVNGSTIPTPPQPPAPQPQPSTSTVPPIPPAPPSPVAPPRRQQEYAGTVMKCPNCGSVISETTAICPDCGVRITGRAAVGSVQAFKEQLMEIESRRKASALGLLGAYAPPDPVDKQKLALIKNFPIPNTVDDILEFMMLAMANIDVSLSKKSWTNSSRSMEMLAIEMPKIISDAWVAKMQQAYQKAEIMFPTDPAFTGIQRLYFDKMKELKIKV